MKWNWYENQQLENWVKVNWFICYQELLLQLSVCFDDVHVHK